MLARPWVTVHHRPLKFFKDIFANKRVVFLEIGRKKGSVEAIIGVRSNRKPSKIKLEIRISPPVRCHHPAGPTHRNCHCPMITGSGNRFFLPKLMKEASRRCWPATEGAKIRNHHATHYCNRRKIISQSSQHL